MEFFKKNMEMVSKMHVKKSMLRNIIYKISSKGDV